MTGVHARGEIAGLAAAIPRRLLLDPGAEPGGDGPPGGGGRAGAAALLVGPEGGLAPGEREELIAAGWAPVGLGDRILRTETAAVVGAAGLLGLAGRLAAAAELGPWAAPGRSASGQRPRQGLASGAERSRFTTTREEGGLARELYPDVRWIWMNGKLVDWDDAKIHIAPHVIHYGSGVFEGVRCYETPEGLRRLPPRRPHRAPLRLGQDLPDGHPVHAASELNAGRSSRRSAPTSSRPATSARSSTAATASSASTRSRSPGRRGDHGLGVGQVPRARRRSSRASTSASAPGRAWRPTRCPRWPRAPANYVNSQLIKMEAVKRRLRRGHRARRARATSPRAAARTSSSCAKGTLITPPLVSSVLAGHHARQRDHAGPRPRDPGRARRRIPREMLYLADELFFTGTAAEITPIRSVDRITVGAGTRGPGHRGAAEGVLRRDRGPSARDEHGWLTFVRGGRVTARRRQGGARLARAGGGRERDMHINDLLKIGVGAQGLRPPPEGRARTRCCASTAS